MKSLLQAKHTVLSAIAATCLLGCATGDKPVALLDLPATNSSFRNAAAGQTDGVAFAASWWQAFADPALASLIARAQLANHDVLIAAQRVLQARAGSAAAASRLLPTVAVAGSASDQRTTLSNDFKRGIPDTRAYRAALDLGWEIDVFGAARASADAASLDAMAAEAGVQAARLAVASEMAKQYTLHQSAQARLRLLKALLASQVQTEEMLKREQIDGVASQLDVARAAAETRSVASQIPQLEVLAASTEHQMAVLLGQNPSGPVTALTALTTLAQLERATIPQVPALAPGQPAELLLRRPDLQAAEKQWLAEGARLREAQADTWPKVFLTGVLGGQDLSLNLLNTGPVRFSSLALAFSMPLFNAGRLRANVERQTARERAATLQFEQATLKALQDVESSLVALAQERLRSQALEDAAMARRNVLNRVTSLAREGQVSQLRLQEARRGLMSAELTALESRTELALSGIQLYRALGGGWQVQAEQEGRPAHSVAATASPAMHLLAPAKRSAIVNSESQP